MHYIDELNHDCVNVTVRTDGVDCPELRRSVAGPESQCWIAVRSGQSITVLVDLELSTSQFQVDLVVDGIVRNMYVSTVTPKNEGRKNVFEFFQGVVRSQRSLYFTDMKTSRLVTGVVNLLCRKTPYTYLGLDNSDIQYVDSDQTSVGSIGVIIYKYDQGFNHIRAATLPEHVDDWEHLGYSPGTSGIQPTHETVLEY